MADYSEFGLCVKTKLLEPPARTQEWLRKEVEKDTGLTVASAYLSRILKGQRTPPKIVDSIRKILEINPPQ